MTSFKTRIEKLEKIQPQDFRHLSDKELEARVVELNATPEIQAWLADDSDKGPLRLQALKLIADF